MDEVNAHIQPQSSVCSDSNGEDNSRNDVLPSTDLDVRLCLLGNLRTNSNLCSVGETFGVPIVSSEDGNEYAQDDSCTTIFVLENFEGNATSLGPPALQQLALKKEKLPNNTRPLFNLAMTGVVVCFTGFRNKDELNIIKSN
ncbi:hypothetical protein NQ318_014338 [Aromia moschata]|uniref:Uncharacterized protein n=1 Tax=Aromia moschata TaxID=1265417 RepID=A0AAV8YY24_9CUCU|nr:hypothetical protein NQ318_014338 [Aromia moschata]